MNNTIRLSLPSKGRLSNDSLDFLAACGLEVDKPNPRQYEARIPALRDIAVLFQRPGDIVSSVRDGSVEFGITGMDVVAERRGPNGEVLVLHDALGYGRCTLCLAVPEDWRIECVSDLVGIAEKLGRPVRVATKFPALTGDFLTRQSVPHTLISAEGTLETAPSIGYADLISDLVSSGQTLRDNRLRLLSDGKIQPSQAVLIANTKALKTNQRAMEIARHLLEYFEAHLRASENLAIFANMRGPSPSAIAELVFAQPTVSGLQGPTISQVYTRDGDLNWYALHIVVRKDQLFQAIAELRSIGGSGVVVAPVSYIFDEEPPRYRAMLEALKD